MCFEPFTEISRQAITNQYSFLNTKKASSTVCSRVLILHLSPVRKRVPKTQLWFEEFTDNHCDCLQLYQNNIFISFFTYHISTGKQSYLSYLCLSFFYIFYHVFNEKCYTFSEGPTINTFSVIHPN